jgi:hypothetical protein
MKSLFRPILFLAAAASLLAAQDIVIADFEGPDYGAWHGSQPRTSKTQVKAHHYRRLGVPNRIFQ